MNPTTSPTEGLPVLLRSTEVCARLGFSISTLLRLERTGQFPVFRVGGQKRYDVAAVLTWLQSHEKGGR